ncbi:hypothetical protein QF015_002162 [Paenarthrobacter sp. TE4293]|uniref:hypothetical protein n=1 Tax=Paenarthrobacter sp. TE4293 TaxID=3381695 RepID=UPI003D240138
MTAYPSGYEVLKCYDWDEDPRPAPFDLVNEMRSICDEPTKELREIRVGALMAFVKRMTTGSLLDEDDEKDIFAVSGGRSEVWELKPFGVKDHARMYHGEPTSSPLQMVLLLCHMKDVTKTDDEIHAEQTARIGEAIDRFDLGRNFEWGNRVIDKQRREAARTSPSPAS